MVEINEHKVMHKDGGFKDMTNNQILYMYEKMMVPMYAKTCGCSVRFPAEWSYIVVK